MDKNRFMAQQDDYINDISGITDTESFSTFLRIAFDTNPAEMCFGAILIIVVSIYINKKTSAFVKKHVSEYIKKKVV